MVTCSVLGCSSRSSRKSSKQKKEEETKKITFFRFPKNEELRNKWTEAVNIDGWEPSTRTCVCSKHFTEDMIDRTSLSSVRIRENAVPTIFPKNPKYRPTRNSPRSAKKDTSQPTVENIQQNCEIDSVISDVDPMITPANTNTNVLIFSENTSDATSQFPLPPGVRIIEAKSIQTVPRPTSPTKETIVKHLKIVTTYYKKKIRRLETSEKRHLKKISELEAIVRNLQNKIVEGSPYPKHG